MVWDVKRNIEHRLSRMYLERRLERCKPRGRSRDKRIRRVREGVERRSEDWTRVIRRWEVESTQWKVDQTKYLIENDCG